MRKISLIISLLILLVSCHKDQDIMPNPTQGCDCAHEVSSDFLMEEMTESNINFARYTDTDTIYANKNVRFTAKEEGAEYTWYIGAEVLYTNTVTRFFSDALIGQTLPITLVVKKNPNTICFPNDDGFDSITKYLTIIENNVFFDNTISRLEGQYKVKSPLLSDSTIITIDIFYLNGSNKFLNIYNYDGLGSNCINVIGTSDMSLNFRQIFVEDGEGGSITQGDYIDGTIYCDKFNKSRLDFSTGGYVNGNYIQNLKDWKYRGRKL